jgi:hypothetical protein
MWRGGRDRKQVKEGTGIVGGRDGKSLLLLRAQLQHALEEQVGREAGQP